MAIYIILLLFTVISSSAMAQTKQPPVAKKQPKVTRMHGFKLIDNYSWLRNREDSEVMQYLKDENDYSEYFMRDCKNLRKDLFQEMKSRIKEDDLSVPIKKGKYTYYARTEKDKQYYIHCRKGLNKGDKEEVFFDENKYAEKEAYFALGALDISPNHKLLAYSVDTNGSEKYTLHFLDLETKKEYPETIPEICENVEWAEDNKTVFYTLPDKTGRSCKLFKHELGTDVSNDKLLYEETDGKFTLGIDKTRDNKYILVSSGSSTTTECWYLDANKPDSKLKLFAPRKTGIEYNIIHHENDFYIVTNEGALNYKVMRTSDKRTSKNNWKEFIPHSDTSMIDDFDEFKDYLVVTLVENGLKRLKYYEIKSKKWREIPFNEAVYSFTVSGNPEFETENLRFYYQSLTTPESVCEYNFNTNKTKVLKQNEVMGGKFKPENYHSERIYARAADGMAIPISLVYRRDMHGEHGLNPRPLYLNGYGSYGVSSDPYFSTTRLSLLDRGFVFAIAHIRGGQELGKSWYNDGKLLKKKNTFTDFIACAEYLISAGYTTKELLVADGGSAGGLLMGCIANMRPDLFKIIVADVPFVDMMNTMLDVTLPLVQEEYEEWGNPNQKKFFEYMLSYSPYDNIKAETYPNMLVTAGLNDPRVSYWEPAKYVAKLRAMKKGNNALLLKTNMDAGHGGASGRFDYLKEIAFEYAFIFKILKINK